MAKKKNIPHWFRLGKRYGQIEAQESLEALFEDLFQMELEKNEPWKGFLIWTDNGYVNKHDYTKAC